MSTSVKASKSEGGWTGIETVPSVLHALQRQYVIEIVGMDLTPASALQQNDDRQRPRQAAALSPLPVAEEHGRNASGAAGGLSLQQRFQQRMQQTQPPDPLLAAAGDRRRAQLAASQERHRAAQAQ
jgi:hypothetical protein